MPLPPTSLPPSSFLFNLFFLPLQSPDIFRAQAGEEPCTQATWLLLKVLHNITSHPTETKYRKLRTNSETVSRLLQVKGVTDFLCHVGFTQQEAHFVLAEPDLEVREKKTTKKEEKMKRENH